MALKGTLARCALMPNFAPAAKPLARSAAAISAFDGTQPVLRHSPPNLPFSISTTGTPNAFAAAATDRPPEPAPMTQMSGLSTCAMRQPVEPVAWRRARKWRTSTGSSASAPSAAKAAINSGVSMAMASKCSRHGAVPAATQAS